MSIIIKALLWAFVILLLAGLQRFGLITGSFAQMLTIALPGIAFIMLTRRNACPGSRAAT